MERLLLKEALERKTNVSEGKSIPGRENSKCKGPEVVLCQGTERWSTLLTGAEKITGNIRGQGQR